MAQVIASGILLLFIGYSYGQGTDTSQCPQAVQSNNSTLRVFGGSCLEFSSTRTFWKDAKADCESRNGRLLEIKSAAMQNFTYTTLQSLPFVKNGIWLGIDDIAKESNWVYSSTGETISTFSNWAIGQPVCYLSGELVRLCIEDCGVLDMDEYGQWNDQYCHLAHLEYTYVCEYVLGGTGSTSGPTTAIPATAGPTTAAPTTAGPTTAAPTTDGPRPSAPAL